MVGDHRQETALEVQHVQQSSQILSCFRKREARNCFYFDSDWLDAFINKQVTEESHLRLKEFAFLNVEQ